MFEPADKVGFVNYINSLKVEDTTKGNYRTWANRLDIHIRVNLTRISTFSEGIIWRVAASLPPRFNDDHREDARSILRHYRRYRDAAVIENMQERVESPKTSEAARERILRSIAVRRGQKAFRDSLMKEFGGRCVVTLTDDENTLEAAHILPYAKKGASIVSNGLLLRSDIHVLFDLHLMSIHPQKLSIYCHRSLRSSTTYGKMHGCGSLLANLSALQVDLDALQKHFEETKGCDAYQRQRSATA